MANELTYIAEGLGLVGLLFLLTGWPRLESGGSGGCPSICCLPWSAWFPVRCSSRCISHSTDTER